MFKRVLAIAVIGAAALTSVGACASDRGPGYRYTPPAPVRYVHVVPPVRYVAPRYHPAYRWAPPLYRWAPTRGYYRYGYHPRYGYWNGHGPNRWTGRDDHRDDRYDRGDDHRNDWRGR